MGAAGGQHMRTTVVSQGSSVIAPVIPILLSAPKYLDGEMTLGQVMQAASAFTIVQSAFGWLVDNYPRLAEWNACARRIASLMVSLDALERAESGEGIGRIDRGETRYALRLNDLSVTLDDGTAVVSEAEVAIEPGERVLVAGESGTGKSTLVRAIAGLWPWGGGSVDFHNDGGSSCCRKSPTCPPARCGGPSPIPAPRRIGDRADRRGARQGRARASQGEDRGGCAVGPDAVRRREAAPRLCAGACCTTPTSSCWTRRRRRSIRRARTR